MSSNRTKQIKAFFSVLIVTLLSLNLTSCDFGAPSSNEGASDWILRPKERKSSLYLNHAMVYDKSKRQFVMFNLGDFDNGIFPFIKSESKLENEEARNLFQALVAESYGRDNLTFLSLGTLKLGNSSVADNSYERGTLENTSYRSGVVHVYHCLDCTYWGNGHFTPPGIFNLNADEMNLILRDDVQANFKTRRLFQRLQDDFRLRTSLAAKGFIVP